MQIIDPSYEILQCPGVSALYAIELAGRTCYKSEGKMTDDSAPRFCRMLMERGHESVLEHSLISVRFVVSRGVSHELVRHRLASYSQESQRYCAYGELVFIRPCFFKQGSGCFTEWLSVLADCESKYGALLAMGAKPEEARDVLPNATKTEIVCSANIREWRHILKLRTSKAAHPAMREVMIPLLRDLQSRIPILFDDIEAA